MKSIIFSLFIVSLMISCQQPKEQLKADVGKQYNVYGDTLELSRETKMSDVNNLYDGLIAGDTISAFLTAEVTEVCKKKGCWMKLATKDNEEIMVHFKDYSFFVPEDIVGREVVLQGAAFVDEVSVEDQQHYAKDAGKRDSEIALITENKKTYTFLANGVLTKK